MNDRVFHDLLDLKTFNERYQYLRLDGIVGKSTFGFDRYLNQILYTSNSWKRARDAVIVRDNGCDLGIEGYEIHGRLIVHHMNPIDIDDIKLRNKDLFNPDYLICVSHDTHNAIHFGDESLLRKNPVVRYSGDTCPWAQTNQNGRS